MKRKGFLRSLVGLVALPTIIKEIKTEDKPLVKKSILSSGRFVSDKEDLLCVGEIVTPSYGSGNNMVVAIRAESMSGELSYPIRGDIIMFRNRVQAQIVQKDIATYPHRFTLRPIMSNHNLDDAVDLDDYLIITHSLISDRNR